MTKAEEILAKYPSVKLGLDEHYGKQTVLNALNEALRIPDISGSLPSQNELIELIREIHKYSLYKISEEDDRPTHLPHWLFGKVEMVIGNEADVSTSFTCNLEPKVTFINELWVGKAKVPVRTELDFSGVHPLQHEKILEIAHKIYCVDKQSKLEL